MLLPTTVLLWTSVSWSLVLRCAHCSKHWKSLNRAVQKSASSSKPLMLPLPKALIQVRPHSSNHRPCCLWLWPAQHRVSHSRLSRRFWDCSPVRQLQPFCCDQLQGNHRHPGITLQSEGTTPDAFHHFKDHLLEAVRFWRGLVSNSVNFWCAWGKFLISYKTGFPVILDQKITRYYLSVMQFQVVTIELSIAALNSFKETPLRSSCWSDSTTIRYASEILLG